MAALVFHICCALDQLCEAVSALRRCEYNFKRSWRYLRTKQRLQLFARYLSEVNLAGEIMSRSGAGRRVAGGIDFAAIEASSEAFEVIDSFAAEKGRRSSGVEEVDFLQMERQHAETIYEMGNYEDIEEICGMEDATFYEYADARPVFQQDVPVLVEGDSLTFSGYIKAHCERFSINFVTSSDHDDIALHINPRLPQNYIVRNTRVRNTWGREEVSSPLPFSLRRGTPFAIQVLVTDQCYMISVNGHHFAEYAHRLSKVLVRAVEVRGDVDAVQMVRTETTEYPQRSADSQPQPIFMNIISRRDGSKVLGNDEPDGGGQRVMPKKWRLIHLAGMAKSLDKSEDMADMGLPLPYYGTVPPKTLTFGRCLKIEGRVKLLPHSFYINLQRGSNIWPHPTIAFHFNPRFSKHGGSIGQAVVCRNAWHNGGWGVEERSELNTNLRPGKTFSMIVDCGRRAFDVYVNGKLITTFKYQVDPAVVDTVYIQGDIKLWNVVVERSETVKKNLFENPTYITDDY